MPQQAEVTEAFDGIDAQAAWNCLAERFAFLGNSLLNTIDNENAVGLHASFWETFAEGLSTIECDNSEIREGISYLIAFTQSAPPEQMLAVQQVAVEYAQLFIGPPKPAAPPWETMYAVEGRVGSVGFGHATGEMQELLRESHIVVNAKSNQYADHMGLELLYLSILCERFVENPHPFKQMERMSRFIARHPLSWFPAFRRAIEQAQPQGYYRGIAQVAEGMCTALASKTTRAC